MFTRRVATLARASVRVANRSAAAPIAVCAPSVFGTRAYGTLGDLVAERAAQHPRREVLRVPHQDISWDASDLMHQTDALAAGLVEIGYTNGAKLALWMANETEHLCAVLAAAKVGCTVVCIDPHVSVDGVKAVLKAEGCRGLMFGQRFKSEHRGKAVETITDLSNYQWGDMINDKSMRKLRHLINTGHNAVGGLVQYKHFPVYNPDPNPLPIIRQSLSADDVLVVPYSASTSGEPVKGEALTQANLISTAQSAAKAMALTGDDIVCVSAWLHNRFGLAAGSLAALHAGAKVVLPSREEDAITALNSISEFGATAFVGSAASLAEAPALSAFDLTTLRTGLLAGVAAPAELTGVQAVDEGAVQSGTALA